MLIYGIHEIMDEQLSQLPESQYQAPIPEHKHFLNKKFIITFVILILLGFGAYAGIWYWQKQQVAQETAPTFTPGADLTADWKTYTNTQYGFEFKYPTNYFLTTQGVLFNDKSSQVKELNSNVNWGDSQWLRLGISLSDKNSINWANDLAKRNLIYDFQPVGTDELEKINLVAGEKSIISIHRDYPDDSRFVVTAHFYDQNNEQIFIGLDDIGPSLEESINNPKVRIFDQILSTFKFTDSVDTSTWKTYTNTQYGFEFKYPVSWAAVIDWDSSPAVDYLSAGGARSFVAIFPTTYPAQDYDGRIDVYSVPKSTVLKDNPHIKNEIKVGDVIVNGVTWVKFNSLFGVYDFFTETNSKTYEVQGTKDITDQILSTFKFTDQGQIACTQEAKQCPDGSYVGRTGPNCEFAVCPK